MAILIQGPFLDPGVVAFRLAEIHSNHYERNNRTRRCGDPHRDRFLRDSRRQHGAKFWKLAIALFWHSAIAASYSNVWRGTTMNLDVEELNDIDQLEAWRPSWTKLWKRSPGSSFFHSCEWLEATYQHSLCDQSLCVLVVKEDQEPIGVLPLVNRREARRLGTARVLTYPLNDWGPYYGPIGSRPKETLRAGLEYVLSHRERDWDLLDLRWTPPDAVDPANTVELLGELGLSTHARLRHQTSIVDLEGSWDEYVRARSKNWRSHYRRRHKRAAQAGKVRHLRYRPLGEALEESDPRFDLYDTCVELANKSWQGSSETGNTLNHAAVREVLRAVHQQAVRLGCLDLNLVYLDEQPISFAYNYHYQGHVFALRLGFDPEYSKLGPGNLVEELAIEDSFSRGDHIYELGPDAEESKRSLRTRLEPIWQHSYYSPRALRSQIIRLKTIAQEWSQSLWQPTLPSAD